MPNMMAMAARDAQNTPRFEAVQQEQGDERGEDAEIAVCEIDEAHHAEHEGEPGREQCEQPAQEDPLHGDIHPIHAITSRSRPR